MIFIQRVTRVTPPRPPEFGEDLGALIHLLVFPWPVVELKGQAGSVQKVNSSTSRVRDGVAVFNAAIDLEVKDGSEELRLLVCKKKPGAANVAQVVAAAGIFVKDIMKMGSISKDFDLYKPGGDGNLGGKISLDMKFTPTEEAPESGAAAPPPAAKPQLGSATAGTGSAPLLAVLALAAAAGLAIFLGQKRGEGDGGKVTGKKAGRK